MRENHALVELKKKFERGKESPTMDSLVKTAKVLDVRVRELTANV
jgi:hypothetical protein